VTVVVGTTLTTFAMSGGEDVWGAWLRNAEAIRESADEVVYFAAIEVDGRGLAPFGPLLTRLSEVGGMFFTYALDDGRTEVTTANRLRHITCGQNLVSDFATEALASHLLFLAADLEPPADCLPKLIACDAALVGGYVGTYCLDGEEFTMMVEGQPVEMFVARGPSDPCCTAAFMLLRRDVFTRLKWRHDPVAGLSDDPALQFDVWTVLGEAAVVRRDVVGRHWPESVPAIEGRGYDLSVVRP
jgi:hypothetical protein